MSRRFLKYLCTAAVLAGSIARGASPQEAQAGAVASQQAAVAAQTQSVRTTQRAAIARQLGGVSDSTSFFDLPGFEPATPTSSEPAPQSSPSGDCAPLSAMRMNSIVERAARREDVPASLIHAVIQQESGGSVCAVSPKGAQGLMQLMPGTAAELDVTDPMDPEQNISAGAKLLGQLTREYRGDLNRVLAAYNAGRKRVEDAGGVPNFPETLHYVSAILAKLGFLNQK
jgi:soluble lytic murein transglycosylase-like protein